MNRQEEQEVKDLIKVEVAKAIKDLKAELKTPPTEKKEEIEELPAA